MLNFFRSFDGNALIIEILALFFFNKIFIPLK